jgi:hypothetical protein
MSRRTTKHCIAGTLCPRVAGWGGMRNSVANQWRREGGGKLGVQTPSRNSEVLIKLIRISSSVENTSHNKLIWIRVSLICKLTRTPDFGVTAPDLRSLCRMSWTVFVENTPPSPEKIMGTPLLLTRYGSYEVYDDRNRTSSWNFDSNQNDREYLVYESL